VLKHFCVTASFQAQCQLLRKSKPIFETLHMHIVCVYLYIYICGKGKAVPLQAWSGAEGSRKLRFPDFMTTAQDDGKVVSLTHRPLFTPRKWSWYSFLLEAESTPGPLCDRKYFMSRKNSNDTSCDRTSDLPICSTAP